MSWDMNASSSSAFDFSNHNSNNTANGSGSGSAARSAAFFGINPSSGAAVYANPQDMAFAQSNMALPDFSTNVDDPMFWGNLDYNLQDVFNTVTWENMTGPAGPGPGLYDWGNNNNNNQNQGQGFGGP